MLAINTQPRKRAGYITVLWGHMTIPITVTVHTNPLLRIPISGAKTLTPLTPHIHSPQSWPVRGQPLGILTRVFTADDSPHSRRHSRRSLFPGEDPKSCETMMG